MSSEYLTESPVQVKQESDRFGGLGAASTRARAQGSCRPPPLGESSGPVLGGPRRPGGRQAGRRARGRGAGRGSGAEEGATAGGSPGPPPPPSSSSFSSAPSSASASAAAAVSAPPARPGPLKFRVAPPPLQPSSVSPFARRRPARAASLWATSGFKGASGTHRRRGRRAPRALSELAAGAGRPWARAAAGAAHSGRRCASAAPRRAPSMPQPAPRAAVQ